MIKYDSSIKSHYSLGDDNDTEDIKISGSVIRAGT